MQVYVAGAMYSPSPGLLIACCMTVAHSGFAGDEKRGVISLVKRIFFVMQRTIVW